MNLLQFGLVNALVIVGGGLGVWFASHDVGATVIYAVMMSAIGVLTGWLALEEEEDK